MRRTLTVTTLASLALLLVLASPGFAAPLPEKHPYQKTLRDYMATLKEADFAIELKPVTYDETYFKEIDTVARYWLFFLSAAAEIPSDQGMRVAPVHFTLAAIEAGEAVNISSGRTAFMDPKDAAWWAKWDYPGNPYQGSAPLKRRAIVVAGADMMMQDQEHEAGKNLRSDYLGGSIIRYAYTYRFARDIAPEPVQKAYAEGLVRMFEKLEKLRPMGSGGSDMEFFQLVGMWYAADALGGDFPRRALDRANVVIKTITSKTGYEKHGGAFDSSYQGIALRFLTWAALLYKDPSINEALHKMLVLKAHLSLPEPDGQLFGPTHFNTGTAAGAPNDQWAWPSRDLAMGMIDDLALYTVWDRVKVPDEAKMRDLVKARLVTAAGVEPLPLAPSPWHEVHWVNTVNFAHDYYRPGYYQKLVKLDKERPPLTKPVVARGENYITDLNGGGEFLSARFDGYGVVVHTGVVAARWASGVSGKSGGGISAFWTPQGGTVLLGRCRATQGSLFDEWTDANNRGPYTWAVHAITGRGAGGGYFSSSRILKVDSKYEVDGTKSATVTVTGDLAGNSHADPQDELKGSVGYHRELRLDKSGVAVTSGLKTDGKDAIAELWELVPVHTGPKSAATMIELRVKGAWQPAAEAAAEADQIRITRYGKPMFVVLEKPRRVRLGAEAGKGELGNTSVRNVMIDLLGDKENPAVRYRLTETP